MSLEEATFSSLWDKGTDALIYYWHHAAIFKRMWGNGLGTLEAKAHQSSTKQVGNYTETNQSHNL